MARVADYLSDYFAMFSTLSCLTIGERLSARLLPAYQYGSTFPPGVLMVCYGGRLTDGSLLITLYRHTSVSR
jgi:hypothetical protein